MGMFRAPIATIAALLLVSACGGSPAAPAPVTVTNPPPSNSAPSWSEMRSMTATPNPVSRQGSLKIEALYMVHQSGLTFVNLWILRYPDGHEVELQKQTGTNGVPEVLTKSGLSWITSPDQPLGDYMAILRLTESGNSQSHTLEIEQPFSVVR